jgi:hypothetical protein
VGLFRKKETLNEQLLREAGLDRVVFNTPQPAPEEETTVPEPVDDRVPSAPRLRLGKQWAEDTTTSVVAPGIEADSARFTVLPTGDLIVDGEADDDLSALADAIEAHLSPPYKAAASRQEGDVWVVRARRIEVAEFAYPDAEKLDLSQHGLLEFRIDDGPTDVAPPPELLQLGESKGEDFFVTAQRIDGDYWEVMVNRY